MAAKGSGQSAQSAPEQGIERTDLPQNIQRHIGIVPNVPAQVQIDDASRREFRRRDGERTENTADEQGKPSAVYVQSVQDEKAYPARYRHAPVGVAAPENFQHAVQRTAEEKNHRPFRRFTQNHITSGSVLPHDGGVYAGN